MQMPLEKSVSWAHSDYNCSSGQCMISLVAQANCPDRELPTIALPNREPGEPGIPLLQAEISHPLSKGRTAGMTMLSELLRVSNFDESGES